VVEDPLPIFHFLVDITPTIVSLEDITVNIDIVTPQRAGSRKI